MAKVQYHDSHNAYDQNISFTVDVCKCCKCHQEFIGYIALDDRKTFSKTFYMPSFCPRCGEKIEID